jgi:hypothetical protein
LKASISANEGAGVVRRVVMIMIGLTVAGAPLCGLWAGGKGAIGFLAGAAVSWVSFSLLYRLVKDVESAASGRAGGAGAAVLHSLRYVVLGGAIYVIVRLYGVFVPALALGLLVAVAAATIEAVYESFHAS